MIIQLTVTIKYIIDLDHLKFISGASSRAQFVSQLFYNEPIDFINRNVPPQDGVLSIGGEMCYYMRPPYVSDGSWEGTEWRRLLVRNSSLESLHTSLTCSSPVGISSLLPKRDGPSQADLSFFVLRGS
jgi:hypothetical protein